VNSIQKYLFVTNSLFFFLIVVKAINIFLGRIDFVLFVAWLFPIIFFIIYINKLSIRAYQWFCFVLLIYFLFSSLRIFGTVPYWLDVTEFVLICLLFINIMFGPKIISKMN